MFAGRYVLPGVTGGMYEEMASVASGSVTAGTALDAAGKEAGKEARAGAGAAAATGAGALDAKFRAGATPPSW